MVFLLVKSNTGRRKKRRIAARKGNTYIHFLDKRGTIYTNEQCALSIVAPRYTHMIGKAETITTMSNKNNASTPILRHDKEYSSLFKFVEKTRFVCRHDDIMSKLRKYTFLF